MTQPRICFIGAGNMASAIIGGLTQQGYPHSQLVATDPSEDKRAQLSAELGIEVLADNLQAARGSEIIVLAVKPQVLEQVVCDLRPALAHQPLMISIAAGIECRLLRKWLDIDLPMVRCMPNTPALVGEATSVLVANEQVSDAQRAQTEQVFQAIGLCEWLHDEALMHAVTALSGSGPAYVFYMIEALEAAGVVQGLEAPLARRLAAQTVLGAARMVQHSELEPAQLKRNVMSPGGTTERGIAVLEQHDLAGMFASAIDAAARRSVELGELLEGNEA